MVGSPSHRRGAEEERMELETDLKVIEKLAAERDEENWRFRSFLKSADFTIEELDAMVHEIHEEVAGRIDCQACGNCCREILPLLHASDVARLASELKVSSEELTERFLVPDEDEKDAFTFNTKPCPFLSGNCCTVHESRPEDCRSYPHLHKKEFVFRLWGVVGNCAICPIVFNVYERLKARLWSRRRRRRRW